MCPGEWSEITKIIKDEYNNFEGFVILNGTDTMTYTVSVLSFMVDNLNKPIIITGSQKPIGETRSDAVQNPVTAIEIAVSLKRQQIISRRFASFLGTNSSEVIQRSNLARAIMKRFNLLNSRLNRTADEYVVINERLLRHGSPQSLQVSSEYSPKVMYLKISPGMDLDLIEYRYFGEA